jgi:hypothetical protein
VRGTSYDLATLGLAGLRVKPVRVCLYDNRRVHAWSAARWPHWTREIAFAMF